MRKLEKIPDFKDDREISEFMEAHDGFELVDQGLATVIKTPKFSVKKNERFRIDSETLKLLNELVSNGICSDITDAVGNAVRSYVMAVLPHSYKLLRK
jgi:hypothetical protein